MSFIRNSSERFSVYIVNLLHELKLSFNVSEWCFIPGTNNPVCQCTCYNPLSCLTRNSFWIKGPQFLYENKSVFFESEVP